MINFKHFYKGSELYIIYVSMCDLTSGMYSAQHYGKRYLPRFSMNIIMIWADNYNIISYAAIVFIYCTQRHSAGLSGVPNYKLLGSNRNCLVFCKNKINLPI